jgi:enoyl-CoA hydratase/carnithine racemase
MSLIKLEPYGNTAMVRMAHGVTNAVGPDFINELSETLREVKDGYRAMVLAGGEKFFCIGLDLPVLMNLDRSRMTEFFYKFTDTLMDLFTLPLPTACAVKAHAVGAGMTFVVTCDYRFAATGRTLLGLNEIRLGVPAPYAADQMFRLMVGDMTASDLLFRGELIESAEAERLGILHAVAPKAEIEEIALNKVAEIAQSGPRACAAVKRNRTEEIRARYERKHAEKNEEFLDCWFSETTQELLKEAAKKF